MSKDDNSKYLIAIIAFLSVVVLVCVYCWPVSSGSALPGKLHELLILCIPEAIVALMAVPVLYFLFERRGIITKGAGAEDNSSDRRNDEHSRMSVIPAEMEKAAKESTEIVARDAAGRKRDLLVIVDVQTDFISGSLKAHNASRILKPLNSAIRMAEARDMIIAFTKDWHPPDHWSFKENGGPWATHCVRDTAGARLSNEVRVPPGSMIVEFGVEPGEPGYSPLENRAFSALVESSAVQSVYIAGIALEYCVLATCTGIKKMGKRVVALESLIASASDNSEEAEKVWDKLVNMDVERQKRHAVLGESQNVQPAIPSGKSV